MPTASPIPSRHATIGLALLIVLAATPSAAAQGSDPWPYELCKQVTGIDCGDLVEELCPDGDCHPCDGDIPERCEVSCLTRRCAHVGCHLPGGEVPCFDSICEGYDELRVGGPDDIDCAERICQLEDLTGLELVHTSDRDGDGVEDCHDPDIDGDLLSNAFENDHEGYDAKKADSDGDGVPDDLSIHPTQGVPKWTVSALDYDGATACDDGPLSSSRPDPWLAHFELRLVDTWTASLEAPPGWQQDNHVHDRGAGVVGDLLLNTRDGERMVNGEVELPVDIRNYGTTENEKAPRLQINARLKDHDGHTGGGEELMDLSAEADEEIGTFTANLLNTSTRPVSTGKDDSSCWGMLRFRFSDNVMEDWVCTAFHRYKHPDELITPNTDLDCPR